MDENTQHDVESIVRRIKSAAVEVFDELGAGQTDVVYDVCLKREFSYQGIPYIVLSSMPFYYKGDRIDDVLHGHFLIVDNLVLVEIDGFVDLKNFNNEIMFNNLQQIVPDTAIVINFNVDDSSKLFKRVDFKNLI